MGKPCSARWLYIVQGPPPPTSFARFPTQQHLRLRPIQPPRDLSMSSFSELTFQVAIPCVKVLPSRGRKRTGAC